jgi:uncharacterized protein YutE (UPF0331/DUF86 family)
MVEVIKNKISYLKENIIKAEKRIKQYENTKDFYDKETLELAISKLIEEIVETAIKINNLILEKNKSYAGTYSSTFLKLKNFYELDSKLIIELAKTTSLRNKITHEYSQEKEKDLIEKYKKTIELYKKYIEIILKVILKDK